MEALHSKAFLTSPSIKDDRFILQSILNTPKLIKDNKFASDKYVLTETLLTKVLMKNSECLKHVMHTTGDGSSLAIFMLAKKGNEVLCSLFRKESADLGIELIFPVIKNTPHKPISIASRA
jgi:hypothetical protein